MDHSAECYLRRLSTEELRLLLQKGNIATELETVIGELLAEREADCLASDVESE